jgi:histidinol phosphatase-like PHP family hydrolase
MLRTALSAIFLGIISSPMQVLAEDWIPLLKDDALSEWRASGGGESFHAKDRTLTVDGPGQIMYGSADKPLDLTSFELRAEVFVKPGGRAGIAFHLSPVDPRGSGGLEIRIDNSYSLPVPGRTFLKTGSLVWLRPVVKSVVSDDRWFPLHLSVKGKRVQVRVAEQLVVDYHEPDKLESGPRLRHGTLAIRGHGGDGPVLIRKLEVRRLAEDKSARPAPKLDEMGQRLLRLRLQGFPLVDFDTSLEPIDNILTRSRQTGLGAGVVVPCGAAGACTISNDKSAEDFLKTMQDKPVFIGMHAVDRDWSRQFSAETIARFDYVIRDAVTLPDRPRGKRQSDGASDAQAFMDELVKTIERILEHEPIDIYANPTYLPEAISKDYDKLWTPERMRRVVDALARKDVALEINGKLRLPSPAFIKLAKKKDIKFALGAGSVNDRSLKDWDYCLRMIEECALTPDDLWAPKADGKKPIQVRKR